MDISSLLSPQDAPVRENRETPRPTPPQTKTCAKSPVKRTRKPKATSTITPKPASSPAPRSRGSRSIEPLPEHGTSRPSLAPTSSNASIPVLAHSPVNTPPIERATAAERQRSTSGMDTLADLASMQHHQQEARANAGRLRSVEVYDTQLSSATIRPSLYNMARASSGSVPALDSSFTDRPVRPPAIRQYTARSLSEEDVKTISDLVTHLSENPHDYESHAKLVKLLHKGLWAHVEPADAVDMGPNDPQTYELLADLKQATEAMDARFALGEALWIERLQGQRILVRGLEDCVALAESYSKAVREEPGSTTLWLAYAEWLVSLYNVTFSDQLASDWVQAITPQSLGWSEEDFIQARDIFTIQTFLNVLEKGAKVTMYQMHDSHLIWNRWAEIRMEQVRRSSIQNEITELQGLFVKRLQVPHLEWNETFQIFSSLVSTFNNADYEKKMMNVNKQCADTRAKTAAREIYEGRLQTAVTTDDKNAEWSSFIEYLTWELGQPRKGKHKNWSFPLIEALYQRASLRFPSDATFWEDHLMFVLEETAPPEYQASTPLQLLDRATKHCPWSGSFWAEHINAAERDKEPFPEIGEIKHRATSTGLLDAGGMEEVLKVHVAWCGFLRRRAFEADATDEEIDVAEVGIRSAIEDMEELGKRKYGNKYEGDPQYRLERIYVKYLSQRQHWEGARDTWKQLIKLRGASYEFWQKYYTWEMVAWVRRAPPGNGAIPGQPSEATKVLKQALRRTDLDWPEKIIEIYLSHVEDHEMVDEIQIATVETRRAMKLVTARRQKEALEATELAEAQQIAYANATNGQEAPLTNGKRKRDENGVAEDENAKKRTRPEPEAMDSTLTLVDNSAEEGATVKRDRENTTIIVKNLPAGTTEARVRKFFDDCGTMKSLTVTREENTHSATATIEFETKEDVLTAQTRDRKIFDGNTIEVQVGTGTTLFVTNFPASADEAYIRNLFDKHGEIISIRFPSLTYNAHRRFCYLQYLSASSAHAASAALDGTTLSSPSTTDPSQPPKKPLQLIAKLSDPAHRQARSSALDEHRELYVSNVDWTATESDLRAVFATYGALEKVRVPVNLAGKSKGIAFVSFATKEDADKALEMDGVKFKSRLLHVERSSKNPAKRQATTIVHRAGASTSPQPETAGSPAAGAARSPAASATSHAGAGESTASTAKARTVFLYNLPDTLSSARVQALCEEYGPLVKVGLRPGDGSAKAEFVHMADAGKAGLELEGRDVGSGCKILVGKGDRGEAKEARREGRRAGVDVVGGNRHGPFGGGFAGGGAGMARRPQGGGGARGRRGGLGVRQGGLGLGFGRGDGKEKGEGKDETDGVEGGAAGEKHKGDEKEGKSNADFKAMFLKGA